MKIIIKTLNLDLTPILKQYIEEKIGGLEKFLKFCETESEIQCAVEVGRITRHHHQGRVFQAEINLRLPHRTLRSSAESEDVRLAVNQAKSELLEEIKKYKQKSQIQDDKKNYRSLLQQREKI